MQGNSTSILRLSCPSAPADNTHNHVSAAQLRPGDVQSRTVVSNVCMCCVLASCSTVLSFVSYLFHKFYVLSALTIFVRSQRW